MTASNVSASQALAQQVAKNGSSLLALKQTAATQKAIADVVTEATDKITQAAPTAGRGQKIDIST